MSYELTMADLDTEAAQVLPSREALGLVHLPNIATVVGVNTAIAINVGGVGGALAQAGQFAAAFQI